MNYNNFIEKQKSLNAIPEFCNTEEAEKFGAQNKNNKLIIGLLEKEREKLLKLYRSLMNEGKEKQALFLASGQSQFVREALQKIK